jgi:hypothetical protein
MTVVGRPFARPGGGKVAGDSTIEEAPMASDPEDRDDISDETADEQRTRDPEAPGLGALDEEGGDTEDDEEIPEPNEPA